MQEYLNDIYQNREILMKGEDVPVNKVEGLIYIYIEQLMIMIPLQL